ncbi:MAG: NlpC/P60 family protein, partial [Oribacterium sp.]|nr:NlpC/P60 family protein [Oribacterium sp.]
CSGFVMSVYSHFGISLPHSSDAMAGVGSGVSGGLANALPGDIIVYDGHVGIYLGGGRLLSALNSRKGITINSASYKAIESIRRVL